ncbi:hypothetical protein AB833_25655 [Chromatiales bacterium (ex Bugula neritina AB1)]|nr:hypothetical protein AB833_25655 [Chromatiales bacterium (ex Bugula neritina AB1)]
MEHLRVRDFATPLLFATVLLAATNVSTAGIYKYIDENGQVAYSDKQIDGAEKMNIKHLSRRLDPGSVTETDHHSETGSETKPEDSDISYQSLEILTPKNDRVVADRSGTVEVIVLPTPRLGASHELVIVVDGKDISRGRSANITLSQVPRGSHNVGARILDANGQTLITATEATFHIKRPIIDRQSPLAFDSTN